MSGCSRVVQALLLEAFRNFSISASELNSIPGPHKLNMIKKMTGSLQLAVEYGMEGPGKQHTKAMVILKGLHMVSCCFLSECLLWHPRKINRAFGKIGMLNAHCAA